MNWYLNLKTRSKLLLAFGTMVLLLGVVIVTAFSGISMIQRSHQAALALAELEANINSQRASMLTMLASASPADQAAAHERIKIYASESDALFQKIPDFFRDDPEMLAHLRELGAIRDAHRRTREEQSIPLVLQGRMDEARAVALGINEERYVQMRDLVHTLSLDAHEEADRVARQAVIVFFLTGLLAVLVSVALAFFLSRIIASPLKQISVMAERIAAGNLASNGSTNHRKDEVGTLAQSFSSMTHSLSGMAGVADKIAAGDLRVEVRPQSDQDVLGNAFALMVANLRQLTAEITEGVNVLGSSASEISTSTSQFAATATETAAAVTETSTTVEEVRQTAEVSTNKARAVSETAQRVREISQSGRQATEETVEGMNRIRHQMDAIAESMMRLSEQSQAIGQIVTTVEDLAAQSNLLSVNASIEAAKAGEYGKGFAVVAQEVKSLAEQSREATRQVRTILNDIQKATSAAMLATEQGSKAVDAGVKQSSQAGESIQALAESVAEAAQAAAQIAASSQQQLIGVDQVASAMESISIASTQNVSSARQLETAAFNLKELGHKLKQVIERYRV